MPRIVDGDNLLGAWPGRSRSDADKRDLAREIDRLARRDRKRIVVVFDGPPPSALVAGPDVVFAGPGRTADAAILELLRGEADPRGWTLVTGDRRLADRGRGLGAAVERPATFRARLAAELPEEKPERPGDLGYWLDVFGSDEE